MQSILTGTAQKAGEAISGALSSNKKIDDLKSNMNEPTSNDRLTSDYGVKQTNTDVWLSASTDDRQGPQLLEDHFAREKVCPKTHHNFILKRTKLIKSTD